MNQDENKMKTYAELGLRQAKELYTIYGGEHPSYYDYVSNALRIGCILYVIDGKEWLLHYDAPEPNGLNYDSRMCGSLPGSMIKALLSLESDIIDKEYPF